MTVRSEFVFLNRLRESGTINMFGAPQVLQEALGLSRSESHKVFTEWMQWVNQNPSNLDK